MWLILNMDRTVEVVEGHNICEYGKPTTIYTDRGQAEAELLGLQAVQPYDKFVLFEAVAYGRTLRRNDCVAAIGHRPAVVIEEVAA